MKKKTTWTVALEERGVGKQYSPISPANGSPCGTGKGGVSEGFFSSRTRGFTLDISGKQPDLQGGSPTQEGSRGKQRRNLRIATKNRLTEGNEIKKQSAGQERQGKKQIKPSRQADYFTAKNCVEIDAPGRIVKRACLTCLRQSS